MGRQLVNNWQNVNVVKERPQHRNMHCCTSYVGRNLVHRIHKLITLHGVIHGLRTPRFSKISNFWALAGIWGIFGRTHFGTVSSLSMFSLFNHYFYKKLSLYIQLWEWDLNLGRKEFEIQPSCVRSPWGSKRLLYILH